ncbi:RnfABCDGE type electron transport complex subunit G [Odoribacter sp. Z80]|uniref:RnfABCDGE type electron transport complex subunit G n=1 Tax=Odoribacter sp. Z80 TaxID=2304575 RepID=UPI0013798695|nr:RnfABCDGE type electron transport complex subunit G [Odoribacter sp. Z80]NCE72819.1 RnfABCDGE type electron transport complex subunit G [Odoribacter sp. Z80]
MGKKLESNFMNMVIVLFAVTLIASAAVGYVYTLTAGPIEAAKQAKQTNAIRQVIPGEFDNDPGADIWKMKTPDGGELEFYPAKKNGEAVGTAVKTYTNNGFGGTVWLMVGFNPDGTISNYSVLEHKETPGLGSKMDFWFTRNGKGNVIGKKPGTHGLKVTKDGGDVDAITAATISSRAFLDAVNRAAAGLAGTADATSGATHQNQ